MGQRNCNPLKEMLTVPFGEAFARCGAQTSVHVVLVVQRELDRPYTERIW